MKKNIFFAIKINLATLLLLFLIFFLLAQILPVSIFKNEIATTVLFLAMIGVSLFFSIKTLLKSSSLKKEDISLNLRLTWQIYILFHVGWSVISFRTTFLRSGFFQETLSLALQVLVVYFICHYFDKKQSIATNSKLPNK